jgi:hypothetical protein
LYCCGLSGKLKKGGDGMERKDNYALQVQYAKQYFLTYDQQKLIEKLKLKYDEGYLYTKMLGREYRIHRQTGTVERLEENWTETNAHGEVMTLLDLVCDSREGRYLSCRWKNMQSFGLMFHQNLLEKERDPWADRFQQDPEGLRKACLALGGQPLPQGDVAYAIELFDGLPIALQFWEGDEEFPPRLRFLWDENALMYIKYETMYYAVNLLMDRIKALM